MIRKTTVVFVTKVTSAICLVKIVLKRKKRNRRQSQGCPANSTKEDGFCYCDEGYKYEDGVCVEDDSSEGLSAMELLERYGLYAVFGVGAVVAVSMCESNQAKPLIVKRRSKGDTQEFNQHLCL